MTTSGGIDDDDTEPAQSTYFVAVHLEAPEAPYDEAAFLRARRDIAEQVLDAMGPGVLGAGSPVP